LAPGLAGRSLPARGARLRRRVLQGAPPRAGRGEGVPHRGLPQPEDAPRPRVLVGRSRVARLRGDAGVRGGGGVRGAERSRAAARALPRAGVMGQAEGLLARAKLAVCRIKTSSPPPSPFLRRSGRALRTS